MHNVNIQLIESLAGVLHYADQDSEQWKQAFNRLVTFRDELTEERSTLVQEVNRIINHYRVA